MLKAETTFEGAVARAASESGNGESKRVARKRQASHGVHCPGCGHWFSKTIDTRPVRKDASVRRRRVCLACGYRYTTYETCAEPIFTYEI